MTSADEQIQPARSCRRAATAATGPPPSCRSRAPRPVSGWLRNRTPRTPWLSAAAPGTAVGVHKVGGRTGGVRTAGVRHRPCRSLRVSTATGTGRRPGVRWRGAATAGTPGRADGRAGRQAGPVPGSWPVAASPGLPRRSARPAAGPAGRHAVSRRPPSRRPPGVDPDLGPGVGGPGAQFHGQVGHEHQLLWLPVGVAGHQLVQQGAVWLGDAWGAAARPASPPAPCRRARRRVGPAAGRGSSPAPGRAQGPRRGR
jgi:hypothetical protein